MGTKERNPGKPATRTGTSSLPDETLVRAVLYGSEPSFERLVARHIHETVRVAAEIVGLDLAEDVVLDAVHLAHRDLWSLQDRARFSPWLLAITRWKALRLVRLERRRPFGHAATAEPVLEALCHLASNPRLIDAGDGRLLAGL